MVTVKVNEAVRFRRLCKNGDPFGEQGVFRGLVGLKVSEAVKALETRYGYPQLVQPMAVNGERTHRRAAQVLYEGDILTTGRYSS